MRSLAAALLLGAAAAPIGATTTLEPVTVTATRVAAPGFEVPAAIERVTLDDPGLGISLAEPLQGVPGVTVRERQNYAQDTQIAIRGFGSRAAFGIRGLRLLLDGIPATQPDGQGQVSHFQLATANRVEVLRGPFSALYGNSSGGVIQVFTADAPATPELELAAFTGSDGDRRVSLTAAGHGAVLGYTDFHTEGFRAHSAATRRSANAKLAVPVLPGGTLTLLANHLDAPDAQDPLGLTRGQFEADPRQVAGVATQFNTRKSAQQTQLGVVYEQALDARWSMRLLSYGGERAVEQFLAIPIGAQAAATSGGGVVDLSSRYGGLDLRLSRRFDQGQWVAGLSADSLRQHRRGFENFVGATTGVRGALRRDETNTVSNLDQYVQGDWTPLPALSVLAGLRHSALRFNSRDHYLRPGNGDDSGRVRYSALTPVAGALWRHTPWLHSYAAWGTGFETPTFAELAYRPDGGAGLNFDLDPARTRQGELGLKARLGGARLHAALFRAETRDELVTASNRGGRATFTNAGRTRRQGAELALSTPLGHALTLDLAYTALDAVVREAYQTCTGQPCSAAQTTIPRGARLPGIAEGQWFSRLGYRPAEGWQLAASYRYLDAMPVNDTGSEAAPAHGLLDLDAVVRWNATLRLSLHIDNVFDTRHAGSVIVNEANGRYYEPGRGRTLLAGLEITL